MNHSARDIAERELLPSHEETVETSREMKIWWRHMVEKLKRGLKAHQSLRAANRTAKRERLN